MVGDVVPAFLEIRVKLGIDAQRAIRFFAESLITGDLGPKEFFKTNKTGHYLMWSSGHIVVVADETVHEFAESRSGYHSSAVADWLKNYKTVKLTVRKLNSKPPLAT